MGRRKIMPLQGGLLGIQNNSLDIGLGAAGDTTLAVYVGNPDVNGCWRLKVIGNDLHFERREAGVWVEKSSILA